MSSGGRSSARTDLDGGDEVAQACHVAPASADGLKELCACQLAASPSAGRGDRRRRSQHRRCRYRAKYTTYEPSKRCGSSSRSMLSGMPDRGFGRCDGHHKMIDFRLEKKATERPRRGFRFAGSAAAELTRSAPCLKPRLPKMTGLRWTA